MTVTIPEPALIWAVGAQLGEGPAWFADEAALRFVDIKGGCIHRFHPETGTRETRETGGQPSFIVAAVGGGFLVGSNRAIHHCDGNSLGPVAVDIAMPEHNRTNDATVDADGRLWFGTMDDNESVPTGAIHCLDRSAVGTTDRRAVVTNGPAIADGPDGRVLYHVDSGQRTIWRVALDGEQLAGDSEVFVRLTEDEGYPDGIVVDSEGCLWVALWDGWGVRRYGPDGTLLMHVPMPCARVTKIAFGGADLKTAYVTTARVGLDAATLAEQPLAGGLFAFAAPVAGCPLPAVRLG